MSQWIKKEITKKEIEDMRLKYGLDSLSASILSRRNVTEGKDILYYMEDDLRFTHSPFLFNSMEDAVDRILDAREQGEKILIFGDRDVDGVTSTTVLYDCLSSMGIDVRYKLPSGDDAYGLSVQAIEDFEKEGGTLIITVDCGISNVQEIALAAEKGMDVIVADHHNAPETLPENAILIDPKLENSGYPFKDISGCAVAYKLVSALRFSESKWYKQEVTLLNVRPLNDASMIECIKLRNLIPVSRIDETVVPGTVSISHTRLPEYLKGQIILVWDENTIKKQLNNIFGSGIEFNFMDIRTEISRLFPQFSDSSLLRIKDMSKIARYGNHAPTEIGGFYNIYVTYVQQSLKKENPKLASLEEKDLQLVALAALADIMPMKNENRIFVKKGLESLNSGKVRNGLKELLSRLNLLGRHITSIDLSWNVVSNLNAAGRLGQPELAAELFLAKEPSVREATADRIIALNAQRKQLSVDAWNYGIMQAQASIPNYNGKLCVVMDPRINRGVCGLLAGRLVSTYDIPAMAVTVIDDMAIGSMRSCRDFNLTAFLNNLSHLFLNFGGHNAAAGFSLKKENLPELEKQLKILSGSIELSESEKDSYEVDAELPPAYITTDIIKICDRFEPYGEENPPLLFMAKNLTVTDGIAIGKGEKQHLKLNIQAGKTRWPALFWNEGDRLHKEIEIGDRVDILFNVERNVFNGVETLQLVLKDIKRSSGDMQ
ncbi:single-stranded-DNA-specific exonuclease RecJ [Treponema rectale]|uniref:Single-stranded-DNA-specific exonuclease RecJ n=1 Tax=Treponema rectale TaxID=744512 RepID=A0A840SCA4_9SPIR|nr:single-stranded-DNA-specific exonuclease RecJ [Treponema rectale]MBB5218474.1 single-stranded-DNA-specific exonuclease [Treponema rectale]QOS39838.1 single-stranded-DNA-specific exonuclease RecJ [Treponema rectale]